MSGPNRFQREILKSLSLGFNDQDGHIMAVRFYDPNDERSYRNVAKIARRFGCEFYITKEVDYHIIKFRKINAMVLSDKNYNAKCCSDDKI